MRVTRSCGGRRSRVLLACVTVALAVLAGVVTGNGRAGPGLIEASPPNLVFAGAPGAPSGPLTATFLNTAPAGATVTGVSIVGSPEFVVWPGGTCTPGLIITPASVCSVDVMFTPLTVDPTTATLQLSTDQGGGIVGLFGNGATPGGGSPPVTFTPGMIDFGIVPAGSTSPPQLVRVTNVSPAAITIDATGVGGNPGFSALPLPPGPIVLQPDSFFDVFFDFTSLTPDVAFGQGTISTSVAPLVVQLFANGAGQGGGGMTSAFVSPGGASLGNILVGQTGPAQLFTITNMGSNPLTFGGVLMVPAPFEIVTDTCGLGPISPAGSCTATVVFKPVAMGQATGMLSVPYNGGMIEAQLFGFGVVIQPGAGSAGGGYYVLAGMPNVERYRERVEWALRQNGDGTVRGKQMTYRWQDGGIAYVARTTSIDQYALVLEGNQAMFTGPALLATVAGGVETPIAGSYRIKAHSFDLTNPVGGGADQIIVALMDEAAKSVVHQTGAPGAPVTIPRGNTGNAYPWTF